MTIKSTNTSRPYGQMSFPKGGMVSNGIEVSGCVGIINSVAVDTG